MIGLHYFFVNFGDHNVFFSTLFYFYDIRLEEKLKHFNYLLFNRFFFFDDFCIFTYKKMHDTGVKCI